MKVCDFPYKGRLQISIWRILRHKDKSIYLKLRTFAPFAREEKWNKSVELIAEFLKRDMDIRMDLTQPG